VTNNEATIWGPLCAAGLVSSLYLAATHSPWWLIGAGVNAVTLICAWFR
jgi:hypothetical protein